MTTRRFTTALVDLDGTLSESEPGIIGSLVEAMGLAGVDVPSAELLRTTIGPPFAIGLPAIGVPPDRIDDVIGHYRRIYREGGMYNTVAYPDVAWMLDELRAGGVVLALATSKPEENAVPILEHLGLLGHFDVVAGADVALGRLAKADVITRALEVLGRDAGGPLDDIVMIGDREHDIEGARHHGIDTIAVAWGYGSLEEHTAFEAWAVADTPADVVRFVLG